MEDETKRYKFWLEVDLPSNKFPTDELIQGLFQLTADKVQEIIPYFKDENWNFAYLGTCVEEL